MTMKNVRLTFGLTAGLIAIASIAGCSTGASASTTTSSPVTVAQAKTAFAADVKPVDNILIQDLASGASTSSIESVLTTFAQKLGSVKWPSSVTSSIQLLEGTLKPLENDFLKYGDATNDDLTAEGTAEIDVEKVLGLKQTGVEAT